MTWPLAIYENAKRAWIEMLYLDQREEECWRMFGIEVEYFHDERIINIATGTDQ